jgi:hypothetical protein
MTLRRRDRQQLERWLTAEVADLPGAEDELRALFAALPELAPPAGFGERVLARAGLPRRRVAWPMWLWRCAAAVTFTLAALLVAVASQLAAGTRKLVDLPSPVGLVLEAVHGGARLVVEGVAAWAEVSRWMELWRSMVSTPQVLAGWSLMLLVGTLALVLLVKTIERERSWCHVESLAS